MGWHNRKDTRTCQCVLTHDYVLGLSSHSLLLRSSSHHRYPFLRSYILHRAMLQALRVLSRYSTGSYPRYARKLLRNVVLGRKFAAAVIEPPYRAQLSTTNPGLLRYTFESDFPWMSGVVAVACVVHV